MENNIYLTNDQKMNEVYQNTEENTQEFLKISEDIVQKTSASLDELIKEIYDNVVQQDASDDTLEAYILELSSALYFTGSKLENMGIKDDLSKLSAKEVFNNSYLSAPVDEKGKKPTVAELTATAEDASKYETIMNNIYSRAYRQLKYKVDAAYELLASLRKILSKRMQDNELNAHRNVNNVVIGIDE